MARRDTAASIPLPRARAPAALAAVGGNGNAPRLGGAPLERRDASRFAKVRSSQLFAWLAVGACVVAILGLGSADFSAAQTSRYLLPLLRWLFPELSIRTYVELAVWIRKAAHVIEYALLGALAFRALWLSLAQQNPLARTALLAIGLAASVALADEIRQSTLQSRTGSPWDVALDVSGALVAIALTLWWKRRSRTPTAAAAGPA